MPRPKTTRGQLKTTNILQHMNQPTGSCYGGSDLPLYDKDALILQINQNSSPPRAPLHPGRYIETFEGCGETFPGGRTFMEEFWADQEQLRLHLSMAAIDSLLSLDIVSTYVLYSGCFLIQTRAEILPSGPKWVCQMLQPEYPHHISFVPRKIWTCAAKLYQVYDKWLSGDRAWNIQEALWPGATLLGVVLSLDKTNISVMSGNHVAHPVLTSLTNIDARIHSKMSLHAYLLLALLPIAKFTHKTTCVCGLLQDRLVHQALNIVLAPLKVIARVGVMIRDPVGNLHYCFTPLAAWIMDTPEENYKKFLKVIRLLGFNGVVKSVWMDWLLSDPSCFLLIEPLHHFHGFAWDHDVQWCLAALGADELDFRFSMIQTPVGFWAFNEGLSKLKQVTGPDHRAIQHYIISIVAGGVLRNFLIAIRALLDFHYLAQAPMFMMDSLNHVSQALQEFHDHKSAIICQGAQDNWGIPKLELLQSVVSGIRESGTPMQWLADVTEHAHVDEIKVPAYKAKDCEEAHEPDAEHLSMSMYITPTRPVADYFSISFALLEGSDPDVPKPLRMFTTSTTVFHLTTKPLSQLSLTGAANKYNLSNLIPAVSTFVAQWNGTSVAPDPIKLQVWHNVHVQQKSYHMEELEPPQTLCAHPPSASNPYGLYDSPTRGHKVVGHSVIQLQLVFRPLHCDFFAAYVHHFNVGNVSAVTGMHILKQAVRTNGEHIGEVIPLTFICSPAHLIPNFGAEAHSHLTKLSSYELSTEFWLNKYWSKESYYTLSTY
ncbi:hypothetical protein V8E55_011873 [Tylopilus felleus]